MPARRHKPLTLQQTAAIGAKRFAPHAHAGLARLMLGNTKTAAEAAAAAASPPPLVRGATSTAPMKRHSSRAAAAAGSQQAAVAPAPSLLLAALRQAQSGTAEEVARRMAVSPDDFLHGEPLRQLWPNQEAIVNRVLANLAQEQYGARAAIVCEPVSRGKTFAALEVVRRDAVMRMAAGGARFGAPWLVVCAKVLLTQWVGEIERLYPRGLLTFATVCITGSDDATSAALGLDVARVRFCIDIVLTTYDTLRCAAKAHDAGAPLRGLLALEYRGLIADEAVVLNNDDTAVFAACARVQTKRRVSLTATPFKTSEDAELNAVLGFLGASSVLVTTPATRALATRAFHAFLVRADGPAPPPLRPRVVRMPFARDDERALYAALRDAAAADSAAATGTGGGGGARHFSWFALLRKMCVSAVLLLPPEARATLPADRAPSTKMAFLCEYARAHMAADEKALVFAAWQATLEEVRFFLARDGHACLTLSGDMSRGERDAAITTFMNGSCAEARFLLLPMALGAMGLNLWRANHVLLVDGEYRAATEEQACGRVRAGNPLQTRACHYYKLVVEGTADEDVLAHNHSKQRQVADFYEEGAGDGTS